MPHCSPLSLLTKAPTSPAPRDSPTASFYCARAGRQLCALLADNRTPHALIRSWQTRTPFSLAGASEELEGAFAACVGEGVERLSQIERQGDIAKAAPWSEIANEIMPTLVALFEENNEQLELSERAPLAWVQARCLGTEKPVLLPADWCLRRAKHKTILKPRTALSTGVAAGASIEAAAVRALLELVERDAASQWWIGGRRGRPLPLEGSAAREAVRLLQVLRQGVQDRATWLLDLTTDLEVPAVAALSFNAQGRGFACGLAARLDMAGAVRAAILEMCQLELALQLAIAKQGQVGADALNEIDRRHLERADKIDADRCILVHPLGLPSDHGPEIGPPCLAALKAAFGRRGIEAALVNLTRTEFAIPVVYALAPALEPMPSRVNTARLRSVIAGSGGAGGWTEGVSLL